MQTKMVNNKEYQLIYEPFQNNPKGKLEWFIKIAIFIIALGYLIHIVFSEKYTSWVPILIIIVTIFLGIIIAIKSKNNKSYNFLKIQDNKLYITTKNTTLWCKPIHEIIEITVAEPKIKWKIILRSKFLIFRTQDDSYCLDLQYSKFDGYSTKDVVEELKRVCNLNA